MLTWEQARSCVLARTPVLSRRRVRLEAAAGRVLAEPLIARNDSPPFDLSAVDGFAVHPKDVAAASDAKPVRLRLAGVLRAGRPSTGRLGRGTAIKILTGAPVPRGAGAVVMQEYCREEAASVEVCRPVAAGENIRPRGGEFRKGRKVLPSGTSVTPPVVGLLAAFGYTTVFVHEQPVVTIVVTGDELLSPSQQLKPGKIRDANSYALAAAVRALGIEKCRTMRLTDRPALLKRQLADALSRSDVLLAVGGMSVGDCDYVRPILGELGVRQEFWRVAVKPGKPVYFGLFPRLGRAGIRERDGGQDARPPSESGLGVRDSGFGGRKAGRDARPPRGRRGSARPPCIVFGLPGNPVSALVGFHQLVKPALLKMMGASPAAPLTWRARLIGERRKPPGRLEWLRGVLSGQDGEVRVEPTTGQDSHMLGGLARANCLIQFPRAADYLADGAEVLVEPLSWRE